MKRDDAEKENLLVLSNIIEGRSVLDDPLPLEQWGVDSEVYAKAVGILGMGPIIELSRRLLEIEGEHDRQRASHQVHLSTHDDLMPEKEVDRVAVQLLISCTFENDPIPPALVLLLAHRLRVVRPRRSSTNNSRKVRDAVAYLGAYGNVPTAELAQAVGVSQRTTQNWLSNRRFQAEVALLRRLIDRGAKQVHVPPRPGTTSAQQKK